MCACVQGRSQDLTKGVLNSADPCSVQTQIHCLAKHLATKDNIHHLVHLLNDINSLERIQHCAPKYILNDYTNDYKYRLINLNILLLIYKYELAETC